MTNDFDVKALSAEQALERAAGIISEQVVELDGGEGVLFIQYQEYPEDVRGISQQTIGTNWRAYNAGYVISVTGSFKGVSKTKPYEIKEYSFAELREAIVAMEALLKEGEGVEGYEECIRGMLLFKNYRRQHIDVFSAVADVGTFDSGLPAGSLVHEFRSSHRHWFTGNNAPLFHHAQNGISTTRPLPAGGYDVQRQYQRADWVPCDYESPPITWRYTFTSEADVLHEAFFDPVDINEAVGADADNGALKPNIFNNGTDEVVIKRVDWQDDHVTLQLPETTDLSDHRLDFIILDGSVSLRLDFGDATETTEGDAALLTWAICDQPWDSGDLLMLRIAEGMPDDGVAATADEECSNDAAE